MLSIFSAQVSILERVTIDRQIRAAKRAEAAFLLS